MPDTNKIRETLIRARALIAVPERWTQFCVARDADGNRVVAWDDCAVCWCSVGAIQHVFKKDDGFFFYQALDLLEDACGGEVDEFNDTHTHAENLAAFDRTIASLPTETGPETMEMLGSAPLHVAGGLA